MADRLNPTKVSVNVFINRVKDPALRRDCRTLVKLMWDATGENAVMWGDRVVGFGVYPHTDATGRVTERPMVSFSPRTQDLGIYIMPEFSGRDELLAKLGKHEVGESGVYVERLQTVAIKVLEKLLRKAVKAARKKKGWL